jgi:hypothetical protein
VGGQTLSVATLVRRSRWAPRAHQKPRPRPISRQQKKLVKQARALMERWAVQWPDGTKVEYLDRFIIIF